MITGYTMRTLAAVAVKKKTSWKAQGEKEGMEEPCAVRIQSQEYERKQASTESS